MRGADEVTIERAAGIAMRRSLRLRPIVGYTPDDALQDARIGVWRALDVQRDADDDEYLSLLVLAGYRDILDGRSQRYSVSAGGAREGNLADVPEPTYPCTAPELLAVAGALAAIERLREPLPRVAAMLIEGDDPCEIAGAFGVSASRVSQWRGELRAIVARALCLAPGQTDRLQETMP